MLSKTTLPLAPWSIKPMIDIAQENLEAAYDTGKLKTIEKWENRCDQIREDLRVSNEYYGGRYQWDRMK